jgi:hypothetical protein
MRNSALKIKNRILVCLWTVFSLHKESERYVVATATVVGVALVGTVAFKGKGL